MATHSLLSGGDPAGEWGWWEPERGSVTSRASNASHAVPMQYCTLGGRTTESPSSRVYRFPSSVAPVGAKGRQKREHEPLKTTKRKKSEWCVKHADVGGGRDGTESPNARFERITVIPATPPVASPMPKSLARRSDCGCRCQVCQSDALLIPAE
jgi:hypothetical protein